MSLRARRGERPNAAPRLPRGILSDGGVGRGALSVAIYLFEGRVGLKKTILCLQSVIDGKRYFNKARGAGHQASRSEYTPHAAHDSSQRTTATWMAENFPRARDASLAQRLKISALGGESCAAVCRRLSADASHR